MYLTSPCQPRSLESGVASVLCVSMVCVSVVYGVCEYVFCCVCMCCVCMTLCFMAPPTAPT